MMQLTQKRMAANGILALGVLLATLIAALLLVSAAQLATPASAATTFAVDRNDDPDPTPPTTARCAGR
jgi:hypothetical protein